jgi:putative tryptophan/tyrosine transport system substrate-binding protein
MRREVLAGLSAAAAGWPFGAGAQSPTPVIGFLNTGAPEPFAHLVAALRSGLGETGFVEGRNIGMEYRWAEGRPERLAQLAEELVREAVAVIAATGGTPAALAAKTATATIPIVFNTGGDPVKLGLVSSLNRPGGNVTGVSVFTTQLAGKRLELLRDLVPTTAPIAVPVNPANPIAEAQTNEQLQDTERGLARGLHLVHATNEREVETAFAGLRQIGIGGLLVAADPTLFNLRDHVVAQAARLAVPAIFEQREFVVAGGLMSYGTSLSDGYRQVGIYAGRILKGEKPADLPVVQSTRFEFVINLKTANALGLTIPPTLLARADEVIE